VEANTTSTLWGGPISINDRSGYLYRAEAIKEALNLFKSRPVHAGHPGQKRFCPLLGMIKWVFWSDAAHGVVAVVETRTKEDAGLIVENGGISAYYDDLTFGENWGEFRIVEKIGWVRSVDSVSEAFMGGRVLSYRAAENYLKF
jgi:hypothetical protein